MPSTEHNPGDSHKGTHKKSSDNLAHDEYEHHRLGHTTRVILTQIHSRVPSNAQGHAHLTSHSPVATIYSNCHYIRVLDTSGVSLPVPRRCSRRDSTHGCWGVPCRRWDCGREFHLSCHNVRWYKCAGHTLLTCHNTCWHSMRHFGSIGAVSFGQFEISNIWRMAFAKSTHNT